MHRWIRPLLPVLLALSLTAAIAAPASATPATRPEVVRASTWSWPGSTSGTSASNGSLPTITLTPTQAWIVNRVITALKPLLCPTLAKLSAPAYQQFVLTGCQALGTSPQPIQDIVSLLQTLCAVGPSTIFPSIGWLIQPLCPIVT